MPNMLHEAADRMTPFLTLAPQQDNWDLISAPQENDFKTGTTPKIRGS